MSEAANRGKGSEGRVQDFLKAYAEKHQDFDWERRYDAHSAGGRFQRQVYDYAIFTPEYHGGVEVKEVKHAFRLPHGNFPSDQVGKLRIRSMAGGQVAVLIYHSTTKLWRPVPLHIFTVREGGSWDLSLWPQYPTAAQAMKALGWFKGD